jgi:hypothetical protein
LPIKWLVRIVVGINLLLAVLSVVTYVLTINSLEFWTGKKDEAGNVGGELDYRWFGVSTIFHVRVNQSLEAVYSFPDTTSYLVVAIIAFNLLILLFSIYRERLRPYWVKIRNLTVPSVIIAGLALWAYAGTMMEIEGTLGQLSGGGVVTNYGFPLGIFVNGVFEGQWESEPETIIFNFTLLLLALLALTVILIGKAQWYPDVS